MDNFKIKPIETVYKGCRFRSRLEARWAVFFDALGVKWEFEPEGFDLGDAGWYLPDFYLRDLNQWVEIKPFESEQPWLEDIRHVKFAEFKPLIVLFGIPGAVSIGQYYKDPPYAGAVWGDSPYYLCECARCGAIGFQFDGRSARNKHLPGCTITGDKEYNADSPRIIAAENAALSARFEHGESP